MGARQDQRSGGKNFSKELYQMIPHLLCFLMLALISSSAHAEPWMANRFANNCAACHAPGRFNQTMSKRTCTLSCQGCHTNPNGGGLRSFYGKWTSQRWLKSFHSKTLGNKRRPLPWFAQAYTKEKYAQNMKAAVQGKKAHRINPKSRPKSSEMRRSIAAEIQATKEIRKRRRKRKRTLTAYDFNGKLYDEDYYKRENGDNHWDVIAKNKKQFESVIPRDDPYFLRRRRMVNVGADFRFFGNIDQENKTTTSTETTQNEKASDFWPMALSVGIEIRPAPRSEWFRHLALVNESLYLNGPTDKDVENLFAGPYDVRTKSSYVLIDGLPWNTFIMHGYYRPMFEHYTPDHNSLAQSIFHSNASYSALFKTTTLGTAPNVPFLNFHLIQPFQNTTFSQEDGWAVNLGARWITLGASLVLSYWDTKNKSTPDELAKTAQSVQVGMHWSRLTLNFEYLGIEKEFGLGKIDKGTVMTLETRIRIWSESYLELIAENSNMAINMKEGSATRYSLGYKIFTLPGMEFSGAYVLTSNETKDVSENEVSGFQLQAHMYF